MMKNARIIRAIKGVCFWMVCLILLNMLTHVFADKQAQNEIYGYASMPSNSLDVLIVGSSTAVTSCSPLVLWKEYGITSYNIAMQGQSIPINYFNLKSALETQSPKVVVLDISYAFQKDVLAKQPARLRQWLLFSPSSLVKGEAIVSLLPPAEWLSHMFQLVYFHDRWKQLGKRDFTEFEGGGYGSSLGTSSCGLSDGIIVLPEEDKAKTCASEISYAYLEKIISLCKKRGIKVLLLKPPVRAYGKITHGDGFELQRQWNAFADYAKEKEVDYLNCMHYLDQIGIHFSSDYADWAHGNLKGIQKVSLFLGNYLVEKYGLIDHRGDSRYNCEQWDNDCTIYYRRLKNNGMELAEQSSVKIVYSCDELLLPQLEKNVYSLPVTLKKGCVYTLLVGCISGDEFGDENIQVNFKDQKNKLIMTSNVTLPGKEWEWSFSVPNEGSDYRLELFSPADRKVIISSIQIVEESEYFVVESE